MDRDDSEGGSSTRLKPENGGGRMCGIAAGGWWCGTIAGAMIRSGACRGRIACGRAFCTHSESLAARTRLGSNETAKMRKCTSQQAHMS